MKYIITIILLIFTQFYLSNQLPAQKEDAIWMFSDSSGLDFNFDPPRIINSQVSSKFANAEAQATISDSSGKLLFYIRYAESFNWTDTNNFYRNETCLINWKNDKIENSDSLLLYDSSTNGALILPIPEKKGFYYVLTHNFHQYRGKPIIVGGRRFHITQYFYSIVDMNLNNGEGKVIVKNKLLSPVNMVERINAVRHANGIDWWIITHERDSSDKFYYFKATKDSIYLDKTQKIGLLYDPYFRQSRSSLSCFVGEASISPDGGKICIVMANGAIDYFNLDRCSGYLSNYKYLGVPKDSLFYPENAKKHYYSTCFSPNSLNIYITTYCLDSIYQVMLDEPDFKLRGIFPNYLPQDTLLDKSCWSAMQLSRQKNYIVIKKIRGVKNVLTKNEIGVILHPDEKGVKSDFIFDYIQTGSNVIEGLGLPNFPNYSLGPLVPTYTRTDTLLCRGDSVKLGSDHECPYDYSWSGIKVADSTVKIITHRFDSVGVYKFWRHRFSASQGCTTAVDTFVIEVQNKHSFSSGTDTIICQGSVLNLGKDLGESYDYSWSGIKVADSTVKILSYKFDSVGVYKFWRHSFSVSQGCTMAVDTFVVDVKNKYFFSSRTDTLICRGSVLNLGKDLGESYNYSWSGIKVADSTVKILRHKFDSVGVYKFWRHRFPASQGCTTAVDTFVVMVKTTVPPCVTALEKHITPKEKIKIYPNPTKDNFMITSNQRVLMVRLYDIDGKKITEYVPDGYPETLTFNVGTVPRGIYLCEVDTEGGKITQRVVVER